MRCCLWTECVSVCCPSSSVFQNWCRNVFRSLCCNLVPILRRAAVRWGSLTRLFIITCGIYSNVSNMFQVVLRKCNTCLSHVILNPSRPLWLHNFVTVPFPYECSETHRGRKGPPAMDSTSRQTGKRWWFPS